ncbi:S4 domain-containing protein, partial [Wolbachia endosymbiont of Pentidionis agamae]|uniref:S4 domain-containing protein n=1 Tax=Wolbachia endosymbiont of Pentidionis agamae TaxID=3110435 RepID=UPI002FD10556
SGSVWLNGNMTKPFDYWQYFRNIDDHDIGHFLRLFTDLQIDEIKKLESLKGREINEAKKILATEVTKICHGEKEAEQAQLAAVAIFEGEDSPLLFDYIIKEEQVNSGITLVDLLFNTKLVASKSAARRLILGNGCKVNGEIIDNAHYIINLKNFAGQSFIKLSAGKKRYIKVVLEVL